MPPLQTCKLTPLLGADPELLKPLMMRILDCNECGTSGKGWSAHMKMYTTAKRSIKNMIELACVGTYLTLASWHDMSEQRPLASLCI